MASTVYPEDSESQPHNVALSAGEPIQFTNSNNHDQVSTTEAFSNPQDFEQWYETIVRLTNVDKLEDQLRKSFLMTIGPHPTGPKWRLLFLAVRRWIADKDIDILCQLSSIEDADIIRRVTSRMSLTAPGCEILSDNHAVAMALGIGKFQYPSHTQFIEDLQLRWEECKIRGYDIPVYIMMTVLMFELRTEAPVVEALLLDQLAALPCDQISTGDFRKMCTFVRIHGLD